MAHRWFDLLVQGTCAKVMHGLFVLRWASVGFLLMLMRYSFYVHLTGVSGLEHSGVYLSVCLPSFFIPYILTDLSVCGCMVDGGNDRLGLGVSWLLFSGSMLQQCSLVVVSISYLPHAVRLIRIRTTGWLISSDISLRPSNIIRCLLNSKFYCSYHIWWCYHPHRGDKSGVCSRAVCYYHYMCWREIVRSIPPTRRNTHIARRQTPGVDLVIHTMSLCTASVSAQCLTKSSHYVLPHTFMAHLIYKAC
jgi:hypothetical protein